MKMLAPILLLLASSQAFAWGDLGHRVVGEIAQTKLTPAARAAVAAIADGKSLAQQATWADEIKSDDSFQWLNNFHFISIDQPVFDHDHHAEDKEDIYNGIKKNLVILKDPVKGNAEKRQALALIAHFVGDIHMPLHVGYTDDRGGNSCSVIYFGRTTNLHAVLDSGVFEQLGLSFTEMARFIRETQSELVGGADLDALAKAEIPVWIQESLDSRDELYPGKHNTKWVLANGADTEAHLKNREYCKFPPNTPKDQALMPRLDYLYNYKHASLLKKRMLLAGLRLAHLLNEAFPAQQQKK